ncbi:hypothetical protein [Paenibacillus riograndensis]|uniref:Uncharacterized protein n=2 Tax=Paenibacillus riograndensis TaxID=483937 RepID=A0A0E3WG03_9BACL|nr:hypothetical protein [Paenibacillus riograndensis]CQR51503.1 hypothetical protein PRIO_0249 [Paenibacillus riograndensis SBR5]
MDFMFGITEFSIFNVSTSPEHTGFQYFKNYAINLVEEINNDLSLEKKYPFSFNFQTLFFFDGEAFHKDETDYISINDGVVFSTFEVFYEMLCHCSVLPYLPPNELIFNTNLYYHFDNEQYDYTIKYPFNKERRIIAEYMAMFAIKFIILHEIGHHYNGHIMYLNSSNHKTNALNHENSCVSLLDLQTLEMDADAFAISRLIYEILVLLSEDNRICQILKSIDDIFTLFVISIHTLFLIFKKEGQGTTNSHFSPYLPSFIRSAINIDCAKTNIFFKAQGIITSEKFLEIAKKSVCDAEEYFYSLYGISHIDDAKDLLERDTSPQINIFNNWSVLRKKLEPFARLRLAD